MISLKEKVDIFVHENFGNSRRLCEDDKKQIRKFLYKHLKSHTEDCDPNLDGRRDSIQSDISEDIQALADSHKDQVNEEELLQKVYAVLNGNQINDKCENSVECDSVDGPSKITLEIIQKKANQMNQQIRNYEKEVLQKNNEVDHLKNEINNCFSVLGLENCEYSLHEVLETYKEKRQNEVMELSKIRDRLDTLERQRHKLDEKLRAKEKEFQQTINCLANAEHENEKSRVLIKDLKEKCEKLEHIQTKHLEKQQTLMTLKSMVQELSPNPKLSKDTFRYPCAPDEVDGATLQLPKLTQTRSMRASKQSRKSGYHEPISSNHHELPQSRNHNSGYPWKY